MHDIYNSAGVIGLKILSGLSTFLLYVAFSYYLSPEKLGIYELALTIIMLFSTLFSLGYAQFAGGEFTRKDLLDVEKSTNKINTAYIFSTLIILLFLVPAISVTSSMFKFSSFQWIIIFITSTLFFYKAMYSGVLQHTFRPLRYSFFEACYPVIIFSISIIYLLFFDDPKPEVMLATHFLALFLITCCYIKEKKPKINLYVKLDVNEFLNISKASYPWFVVALMSWIMYSSDKWVLEYFFSTGLVGLYSQIFKLSSAYNLIIVSTIAIVFTPYIYKSFRIATKQESWNMINKQTFYLCLSTGLLLLLDFAVGEFIYKAIIGEQYYDAFQYNYLIIVNFMLMAIIGYYGYVFVYHNKTIYIQIALFFGALLNLIISLLITPQLGIYGVLFASLISQICMLIFTVIRAKKMLFN